MAKQPDLSHAEIKVNPNDLLEPGLEGATVTYDPAEWRDGVYIGPRDEPGGGDVFAQAARVDAADASIAALPRNPKADEGGVWSWVTGDGRREFNVPEFSPGLGGVLATSTAFGDEGKMGIIQRMYADEQPTFSSDKFGNIMVTFGQGDNKGKTFYVNTPGVSGQDVSTLATNLALTALPGGLAARGAINLGARGALAVGGAAATGAAAGETVRQVTGNALGDQTRANNTIPGLDLTDLALASVPEGVAGGLTFKATNLARPAGAPANIDQIIRDNAAAFDRAGVSGLRGQIAGTGAELERTRVLSNLPETSAGMTAAFNKQNAEVTDAAMRLMGDITPPSGVLAETQARNAATKVIDDAREVRRTQAGPLYDAALDTGKKIDTTALVKEIDAAATAKGAVPGTPFGEKIAKVQKILKAGDDWQLDPRQVQAVKIDISDARKAALREDKPGLANQLADIEEQIVLFLDDAAPGYKEANEAWSRLSVPVTELKDSAVGALANLDQFGLQQFSRKLFSTRTSAAERDFVKANLDKADPQAYRRMVQSEMGRRFDEISDIGTDTGVENTPRLINAALFRNEATRQMWKQALPDMADRLDDLHYVLNLATTGRNSGSATATRGEIKEGLTSLFERGGSGLRMALINWTVGLPITVAEKSLGIVGTARTQAIREAALAEQTAPDVAKIVGDYAKRVGKTNPRLSSILQSIRQYAGTDPAEVGSMPLTESEDVAGIPILTE